MISDLVAQEYGPRRWYAVPVVCVSLLAASGACGWRSDVRHEPAPTITWTGKPVPPSVLEGREEMLRKAFLDESEIPLQVPYPLNEIDSAGRNVQQACNASVESDREIARDDGRGWHGGDGSPVVDQSVFVYKSPIAAVAVTEAEAALKCTSYRTREGTVRVDGKIESIAAASTESRSFGFCEALTWKDHLERCTVIAGAGRVACSVRVWAKDREVARSATEALVGAVRRHCSSGV